MRLPKAGLTLMEILVVLIIIGFAVAFFLPNYTTPTEKARALTAKNNLMAIYTAQLNYRNNNGNFATPASLSAINTAFALNIEDDGTYTYTCASGVTCTATRNGTPTTNIVLTLASPIQTGNINPVCNTSNNWCP